MIDSPLNRALFYAPAKLYELVVRARRILYKNRIFKTRRLRTPVISVGNLTIGGTGKTPCVAFLANFLNGQGYRLSILSRGYKRSSRGRVEVSNGRNLLCGPLEAGDEPYLLAKSCPGVRVVVDADRYAAGRWLEERVPVSAFILDDAYQHLRLARDLNLLLLDAGERLEDAAMIPFGRLREPLDALNRADAVIVTRSDRSFDRAGLEQTIAKYGRQQLPIFYATHTMTNLRRLDRSETIAATAFAGRSVVAVSGIARPERFIADLSALEMRIVSHRKFPDHHRYTQDEFFEVVSLARNAGAEAIMTTEKDAANLPDHLPEQAIFPIYAAQIEFRCEDESGLKSLVLRTLSVNRS